MKPYVANLINAIVLLVISLWAFYSGMPPEDAAPEIKPPYTALIPAAFGIVLLLCTPLLKKENKAVAHIVVLLTFLLIISLVAKPLISQIEQGDPVGIFRVGLMILTSVIAMASFIKSFRDARKARNS